MGVGEICSRTMRRWLVDEDSFYPKPTRKTLISIQNFDTSKSMQIQGKLLNLLIYIIFVQVLVILS